MTFKTKKVFKISDVLVRTIKENVDAFADFLWTSINSSIKSSMFSCCLKSKEQR